MDGTGFGCGSQVACRDAALLSQQLMRTYVFFVTQRKAKQHNENKE